MSYGYGSQVWSDYSMESACESQPIWLTDVDCYSGNTLDECMYPGWGNHAGCSHGEDLMVQCYDYYGNRGSSSHGCSGSHQGYTTDSIGSYDPYTCELPKYVTGHNMLSFKFIHQLFIGLQL